MAQFSDDGRADRPTEIVQLRLPDKSLIRVEALTLDPERDVALGEFEFDAISDQIVGLAKALQSLIAAIDPKSASMEFGVEVGVESGGLTALLVKGTGTANLKITLLWEKSDER